MPNSITRDPERLPYLFEEADAVLVLVGRKLELREGCAPFADARWFRRHFSDLIARHRLRSLVHGIRFRYPSCTMEWAFMGRLIFLLDATRPARSFIDGLERLVSRKPAFMVTTTIGGSLRKSEIGAERLFGIDGDLTLMTCRWGCDERSLPTESAVRIMFSSGFPSVISPAHVPRCPRCGGPMTPAIARDERFALRTDQAQQCYRFLSFLRTHYDDRLLVVELGVSPWDMALRGLATHIVERSRHVRYLIADAPLGFLPPAIHGRTTHCDLHAIDALALLLDGTIG